MTVYWFDIDLTFNDQGVSVDSSGTTDSIANKWHNFALPRNSMLHFANDACLAA